MDGYRVHIQDFDGPLDLLLHLIEKAEVNIEDIFVSEITAEYLAYMEDLTEDELRSLLDTMIQQKVTPTCPHGRPLVVAISHRELDKKFKRIQG